MLLPVLEPADRPCDAPGWFLYLTDIRRYGIEVFRFVHDAKDRAKFTVAKTLTSWDEHTTFQIPQNVRNAGLEPTPRTK